VHLLHGGLSRARARLSLAYDLHVKFQRYLFVHLLHCGLARTTTRLTLAYDLHVKFQCMSSAMVISTLSIHLRSSLLNVRVCDFQVNKKKLRLVTRHALPLAAPARRRSAIILTTRAACCCSPPISCTASRNLGFLA
jgi:hypothetical protein